MIEQGEDWAAGIIPGTDAPAFTMLHAAGSPIPVVVAAPHAGRTYPAGLLARMRDPAYAALRL